MRTAQLAFNPYISTSSKNIKFSESWTMISFASVALIAITALLIGYYVVQANTLAAQTYQVKNLKEQLSMSQEAHTQLLAAHSTAENIDSLNAFAQSHNMVVAKDALHIFNNGSVAFQR